MTRSILIALNLFFVCVQAKSALVGSWPSYVISCVNAACVGLLVGQLVTERAIEKALRDYEE